jgi:hypothetical protein
MLAESFTLSLSVTSRYSSIYLREHRNGWLLNQSYLFTFSLSQLREVSFHSLQYHNIFGLRPFRRVFLLELQLIAFLNWLVLIVIAIFVLINILRYIFSIGLISLTISIFELFLIIWVSNCCSRISQTIILRSIYINLWTWLLNTIRILLS